MKQNKYDDVTFFNAYSKMLRSVKGLEGAGEWHVLEKMIPDLHKKKVLDLGCGFGWHCRYFREQGASSIIGVDLSEKMLAKAREMTNDPAISYIRRSIEEIDYPDAQFDFIFSSLTFHYIKSFDELCKKVYRWLKPGGSFLFSVEHPIFTSKSEQDWFYDENGNPLHWPVDHYFSEGLRKTRFLDEEVIKYHRTFSTYINNLIQAGFTIKEVQEPGPSKEFLKAMPEMKDELRRPMFLIISAIKN